MNFSVEGLSLFSLLSHWFSSVSLNSLNYLTIPVFLHSDMVFPLSQKFLTLVCLLVYYSIFYHPLFKLNYESKPQTSFRQPFLKLRHWHLLSRLDSLQLEVQKNCKVENIIWFNQRSLPEGQNRIRHTNRLCFMHRMKAPVTKSRRMFHCNIGFFHFSCFFSAFWLWQVMEEAKTYLRQRDQLLIEEGQQETAWRGHRRDQGWKLFQSDWHFPAWLT